MLKCYDFRCPSNHITEAFVKAGVQTVRCKCGLEAHRIISGSRFHLPGHDKGYPTAHDKWVREHEKAGKIAK